MSFGLFGGGETEVKPPPSEEEAIVLLQAVRERLSELPTFNPKVLDGACRFNVATASLCRAILMTLHASTLLVRIF